MIEVVEIGPEVSSRDSKCLDTRYPELKPKSGNGSNKKHPTRKGLNSLRAVNQLVV
jgi:hypothetical protein